MSRIIQAAVLAIASIPYAFSAESTSLMSSERAIDASSELKAAADKVVASQSGQTATVGDLVAQVDRVTPGNRLTGLRSASVLNGEIDRILTARILAGEARRRGLDQSLTYDRELKLASEQILARRLIQSQLPDLTDPQLSAAALEKYTINRKDYQVAEVRKISHILVSFDGRSKAAALERAINIAATLKKAGSSFEALAASSSDDAVTKTAGGAIGELKRGAGNAIEAEVFAMQAPGILANPIETTNGYHIVRLDSIQAARLLPFDEVRSDIEEAIKSSVASVARETLTNKLVGDTGFTIDEDALKLFLKVMGSDKHVLFKPAK